MKKELYKNMAVNSTLAKETIIKVLTHYPVCTTKEIAKFAWQAYGVDMTPASVSSQLRLMRNTAKIGSSKNEYGATVYWLN